MARYFLDHDAYAAQGVLGTAAPTTWGVPQEGDGSSKDPAPSASVATFEFKSVPSSGTFSLFGTTIAISSVLNQASTAACATGLANSINTCVTTLGTTVIQGSAQVRNLFFARVNPVNSSQVDIMCRIGSQLTNTSVNSSAAMTHTFNGSTAPVFSTFSGGSGGCWGCLVNASTLGNGIYTAANYGLLVMPQPFLSASESVPTTLRLPNETDVIWIRAGATDRQITLPANTMPAFGVNPTYSINAYVDTNTVWTSDPAAGSVLTIQLNGTTTTTNTFAMASGTLARWITCLKEGGLRFLVKVLSTSQVRFSFSNSGGFGMGTKLFRVAFEEDSSSATGAYMLFYCTVNQTALAMEECVIKYTVPRGSGQLLSPFQGGILNGGATLRASKFSFNYTGLAAPPAILGAVTGGSSNNDHFRLLSCSFINVADATTRFTPFTSMSTTFAAEFVADGCTGLALSGTYMGLAAANNGTRDTLATFYFSAPDGSYRYETRRGVVDYNPGASPAYPTYSALMPDGTPWAVKMDWLGTAGVAGEWAVFSSQRFVTINRLSTAVRTVSLDVLMPSGIDAGLVSMRAYYVDADGIQRTESTRFNAAALVSGGTWAGASNWSALTAKRFSLTTAYPVKTGTEVACSVECYGTPPAGSNTQIFVNPEPGIA
jgi:hypothetical protein